MPAVIPIPARRQGQYSVLTAGTHEIGILLLDPATDRLHIRLRENWEGSGDTELLELLPADLEAKAAEMGGERLLAWFEDTLSNAILISDRESVAVDSFTRVLDRLYERHVEPVAVRAFETHLPLYSMQVAAGAFGEDREARDADEWIRVEGLRLSRNHFVVPVTGRSMEPLIPEGTLNVFRAPVVGSRQNRIVLVQLLGVLDEGARYTVKKYTSVKRQDPDGSWEHEAIQLMPLNPEYPPLHLAPDQLRVIAEWVRTVE